MDIRRKQQQQLQLISCVIWLWYVGPVSLIDSNQTVVSKYVEILSPQTGRVREALSKCVLLTWQRSGQGPNSHTYENLPMPSLPGVRLRERAKPIWVLLQMLTLYASTSFRNDWLSHANLATATSSFLVTVLWECSTSVTSPLSYSSSLCYAS